MFSLTRTFFAGIRREIRMMAYQSRTLSQDAEVLRESPAVGESPVNDSKEDEEIPSSAIPDKQELWEKMKGEIVQHTVDEFQHLAKDEADKKLLHLILLELETLRHHSDRMPSCIPEKDMTVLLTLSSRMQRAKYFDYLFKREMTILSDKVKKEHRRLERESQPKKPTRMRESIYPLIRDQQMSLHYNSQLAIAALFGQKLIIDCSFEEAMNHKEICSLLNQIQYTYATNKIAREPFDLILSDIIEGKRIDTELAKYLPQLNNRSCLVTKTCEKYIEMFPKEKLLYLSPNSNRILKAWNHDDIIIVGGLVDKSRDLPYTLGKAKEQGIRHAKLPLGYYVPTFAINSSQALGVNTVVDLLVKLKATSSWEEACKAVPRRLAHRNERSVLFGRLQN